MANSIQQAKIVSTPSEMIKTNELAGRVRVAFAEYEASAEQSTITMFLYQMEQDCYQVQLLMTL